MRVLGRIDDSQVGEVLAIEAPISGKQRVGVETRVRANQEIRNHTRSRPLAITTSRAPKATRQISSLLGDRLEAHAKDR